MEQPRIAPPRKLLIAYSAAGTHVQTTMDYLLALKRHGDFEVSYVHVTHDAVMDFDFGAFDVVFHSYDASLCFDGYVSESYRRALRRFRGVKLLAIQDEYERTNTLKAAIKDLGFHVVLTCVPEESIDYVYPRREFPNVAFMSVLTGYVPDDLDARHPAPLPLAERPVTVGYRGRDIGARYGRLAYEKFEIGRRMKEICADRGIAHDISMDEDSRIYGMAWFDFIGSCRSMLGSESGSNVFDFNGSIERKYREMAASRGGAVDYQEFLPFVAQRDSEIAMGQISPRVFECAVMKTPMVLYRGRYSGIVEPDSHYIPLEKDFSNIETVLARLEDIPKLEAMAERTYDHLVGSGRFGYRNFSRRICTVIEGKLEELRSSRAAGELARDTDDQPRAGRWLRETPSALPIGKLQFDLKQKRQLVSNVLEPEVRRLIQVFDVASAAYLTEAERLSRAFQAELDRLMPADASGHAAVCGDGPDSGTARERLHRLTGRCRQRHAGITSDLDGSRARLHAMENGGEAESLDVLRQYEAWLQTEIRLINSEIDQLNAERQHAVAFARHTFSGFRSICRASNVSISIKIRLLAKLTPEIARWQVGRLKRHAIGWLMRSRQWWRVDPDRR